MWKRTRLRSRIFVNLALLLMIVVVGGSVMIWYTYRLHSIFTHLIEKDMAIHQVVDTLVAALANQKGFVSYYLIDGNSDWLRQLEKYRLDFKEYFNKVKEYNLSKSDREAIQRIEIEYKRYIEAKDQVIARYKAGEKSAGSKLHQDVRSLFFKILKLCEDFRNIHFEKINLARDASRMQAKRVRFIAWVTMITAILLSVILTVILVTQILDPLRKLASEIDRSADEEKSGDEIGTLKNQVYDLMKDMEKFALVGKLAAGVAHSIRNPLTSVKMRLFSMERSLEPSESQKEDFKVISEEIRNINTIIQNFLEFSRSPRLKIQKVSLSDVVDDSLKLLEHRLESYKVEVTLKRLKRLPVMLADPERLKEALVNLIINACEAMVTGGSIIIYEEEIMVDKVGQMSVIRLSDNGPGISESIQKKIFQPFFSCKEEGTGLGLSIAEKIINEHGGWLDLQSGKGKGATFIINLPLKRGRK